MTIECSQSVHSIVFTCPLRGGSPVKQAQERQCVLASKNCPGTLFPNRTIYLFYRTQHRWAVFSSGSRRCRFQFMAMEGSHSYLCRRRYKVAMIAEPNWTFAIPSAQSACGMEIKVKKAGGMNGETKRCIYGVFGSCRGIGGSVQWLPISGRGGCAGRQPVRGTAVLSTRIVRAREKTNCQKAGERCDSGILERKKLCFAGSRSAESAAFDDAISLYGI